MNISFVPLNLGVFRLVFGIAISWSVYREVFTCSIGSCLKHAILEFNLFFCC